MEYLEHHIVDHCNLNCAGCSHFSPLADHWFEDFETFKRDFTQLYNITQGDVHVIRLMGGEPLLHPHFEDMVAFTCVMFNKSQVQLVTNGILIPKEFEKLKSLSDTYPNFSICISNYGLKLAEDLIAVLPRVRRDNKAELYNISLDLFGEINPKTAFQYCDLHIHHWYYFQNGCFYPCCICANIDYFNGYFYLDLPDEENCISIYNHTLDEIEHFLNQPIPLCSFCNTVQRQRSYHPFGVSKKEINEWICQ